MADKVSRFAPTGSMDKDSDPRYVGKGDSNGDYIDARNIQCVPQNGNENGSISPTLGNEFAFSLGSVSQQNKRYRIVLDGDIFKFHELTFLSTNRDATMIVPNGPNGGLLFNGTVSDFVSAFNLATAGSGVSWVISTPTPGTVEIELASYPMYQWYIDSVGTHDLNPIVIAEAIPVDLAGPLKDIGSYDLLGDLFIFSTTQDNEPTELPITVTAIGPTLFGGTIAIGPITYLTFSAPHGLIQGQWIKIANSNNSWLNGLFLVSQILSPTQIGIPTVLAWGGTLPQVAPGPEIITVSPNGIGEIGVAQKDENTDTWTYIRLLRSVELNFVSKWQVDCHAHKDAVSSNIYYTDDYEPPRVFRYLGDYMTDGGLNYINSQNEYTYGSVRPRSSLVALSSGIKFLFIGQNQTGGVLTSGNKYYYCRIITPGGSTSGWSSSSRGVSVAIESENSLPNFRAGDSPDTVTSKSNTLSIIGSGLEFFLGSEIEFAVLEYVGSTLSATVFYKNTITSASNIVFTHSGKEINSRVLDVNELSLTSESFIAVRAKNIRSIDSRNVLSNIETLDKIDLSKWVATFRHSITKIYVTEATAFQGGEYQDADSEFNNMGFMLNETYRIGCRAFIRGIGKTDIFHVDDITVDTLQNNTGNPLSDRRNGNSITNYDLTEEVNSNRNILSLYGGSFSEAGNTSGSPNDPTYEQSSGIKWSAWETHNASEFFLDANGAGIGSSISRLIIPRIDIENINYDFEIDGFGRAYDIIDGIEFFIGEIPKSVKASGLGVSSVKWSGNGVTPGFGIYVSDADKDTGLSFAEYPASTPDLIYEYPFATGSENESSVSVNYPLSSTVDGIGLNTNINEIKDVISFYSGDTYFDAQETYNCEKINVFGACELVKNWKTRLNQGSNAQYYGYLRPGSMDEDDDDYWHKLNKTWGFVAVFHPRKTKDTYEQIAITDYAYIDPLTQLDLNGTGLVYNILNTLEDIIPIPTQIGINGFIKSLPCFVRYSGPGMGTVLGETLPITGDKLISNQMNMARGPVVKLASDIDLNSSTLSPSFVNNKEVLRYSNRGVFYCQLYTDERSNYPSIYDTKYFSVGSMLLTPNGASNNVSHQLLCGDTRTQTTIVRHRSAGVNELFKRQVALLTAAGGSETDNRKEVEQLRIALGTGFGSGLIFVGQNRVNSNMYTVPVSYQSPQLSTANDLKYYPMIDGRNWNEQFQWESPPDYNTAYNKLPSIYVPAYQNDPRLGGASFDLPTRIIYSQRKDQTGIFDEYRFFLPLDRIDLDRTFGEIHHHEIVNGELFTLQERKYSIMPFNARVSMEISANSLEVVLGSGRVLPTDGRTLSSYGTYHKWGCVNGKSSGGKDVLYWFNSENGLFMRFGADGTIVLSDLRKMRAFSIGFSKLVWGKDTPAFEQGVRTVWDDRSKEVIWTFTGWRELPKWTPISIGIGEVVKNSNAPSDSYEGFPRFFKCKLAHIGSSLTEPGVGADWETYWEQIPYDDKKYYSIFTLAFNEATNGFSTFYGHIPKTYLKWRDTFLSSHPTERNLIFEHRRGEPTTWYESDTTSPKIEDAYIEAVINDLPEESKRFISAEILSDSVPDRIEYRTKSQYTWSEPTDFKVNDDQFRGFILNDATVSQDPRGNTRRMDGDYIKAKFFFIGGTMNKLYSMVVKLRGRLRDFRQ